MERYPGEDYFRKYNPNIRRAEENWERKNSLCIHCGRPLEEHSHLMNWCKTATRFESRREQQGRKP